MFKKQYTKQKHELGFPKSRCGTLIEPPILKSFSLIKRGVGGKG